MKKFFMMAVMAVFTMTASAQIEKGMRYGITFTGTMSTYSEIPEADNIFAGWRLLEIGVTALVVGVPTSTTS